MIDYIETHIDEPMDLATLASVAHFSPYHFHRLFAGLMGETLNQFIQRVRLEKAAAMLINQPNESITQVAFACGFSICITAPPDTAVDGEIGKMTLPGGKYALARFELGGDEFEHAWNTVFGSWLPQSGYQPDERPAFEWCRNNPQDHPEGKHIIDSCVPVKPL